MKKLTKTIRFLWSFFQIQDNRQKGTSKIRVLLDPDAFYLQLRLHNPGRVVENVECWVWLLFLLLLLVLLCICGLFLFTCTLFVLLLTSGVLLLLFNIHLFRFVRRGCSGGSTTGSFLGSGGILLLLLGSDGQDRCGNLRLQKPIISVTSNSGQIVFVFVGEKKFQMAKLGEIKERDECQYLPFPCPPSSSPLVGVGRRMWRAWHLI